MRAARPVAATTRSAASVSSALPSARRRIRTPVTRSPSRARGQAERVAAIDQRDCGQLTHAAAHMALDERPAGEDRAGARRCAGQLMAADHEPHLLERRAGWRPGGGQLGAEARQQRVQARLPMRQQRVGVAALRHRPAALKAGRQGVAIHDGHPLVGLRERPGGQQPGHAAADHHGVLTDPSHVAISS